MSRYFFDVIDRDRRSYYDYKGEDSASLQAAVDLAEIIAINLSCTNEDEWSGATVEVRNRAGQSLFKVPVRADACC